MNKVEGAEGLNLRALGESIWRMVCSYTGAEARGQNGVSPSPSHWEEARCKLLKKGSLGVLQNSHLPGHLATGRRLAEIGNSWAIVCGMGYWPANTAIAKLASKQRDTCMATWRIKELDLSAK